MNIRAHQLVSERTVCLLALCIIPVDDDVTGTQHWFHHAIKLQGELIENDLWSSEVYPRYLLGYPKFVSVFRWVGTFAELSDLRHYSSCGQSDWLLAVWERRQFHSGSNSESAIFYSQFGLGREISSLGFDWRVCLLVSRTFCSIILRYVAQLVETLRHKPEGSGFDSRWCHSNFPLT
jgi:hypothetical protein